MSVDEDDFEDTIVSSTPLQESAYRQKKKRRIENYFLVTVELDSL